MCIFLLHKGLYTVEVNFFVSHTIVYSWLLTMTKAVAEATLSMDYCKSKFSFSDWLE